MAREYNREHEERRRVQRATRRAQETSSAESGERQPTYHNSLLGDPALNRRGNEPVRTAVIQQMQQTYGNRAVRRVLQRSQGLQDAPAAQRQSTPGWSDASKTPGKTNQTDASGNKITPPKGGWNEGETKIGAIRRIPIEGLEIDGKKVGNQHKDKDDPTILEPKEVDPKDPKKKKRPTVGEVTTESAVGHAIALIPEGLNTKKPVEVLLYLHGFGVGYRQRTRTKETGMETGTVRDVEIDRTEQQLESIVKRDKRSMIAVLPQGAYKSGFGGEFDSDKYLSAVFKKLSEVKAWPDPAPARGNVVLSGHSGAGNLFGDILQGAGQKHLPPEIIQPGAKTAQSRMVELVLFDAINGDDQREVVQNWVMAHLNHDLSELKSMPDDKKKSEYLKTSMRFRGYYTHTDNDYYAKPYSILDKAITQWFTTPNAIFGAKKKDRKTPIEFLGGAGSSVYQDLFNNYKVIETDSVHEGILGNPQSKLKGKAPLEDALGVMP